MEPPTVYGRCNIYNWKSWEPQEKEYLQGEFPQKIFVRGHWGIKEMIAKRSQLLALAHVSGNLDWSIAQCAACAVQ